eukprot:CAMPEP_0182893512 /NCGR_PEP_ID=MMETSP0034_2-20130328/24520_1 /TAXON_ID=156128 /ORGANISM="Nephroselmis pyriformis, Strain CCMP717" /LENGTH=76 /DNA_ID=CAMNT_0025027261 /DNA_START=365 /DNA_END=592 /DNA_ORIENTATION=+
MVLTSRPSHALSRVDLTASGEIPARDRGAPPHPPAGCTGPEGRPWRRGACGKGGRGTREPRAARRPADPAGGSPAT